MPSEPTLAEFITYELQDQFHIKLWSGRTGDYEYVESVLLIDTIDHLIKTYPY